MYGRCAAARISCFHAAFILSSAEPFGLPLTLFSLSWPLAPACRDCKLNQTCSPVAGRACARSICNDATGTITSASCTGFCSTGAAYLVSAQLTNDGRYILLRFNDDVYTASSSPMCAACLPHVRVESACLDMQLQL